MLQLFKKKKKEKLPAREHGNACLNCNTLLNGSENFCPECGQRNNVKQLSFKLFVDEFFGDLFTYDSRVWQTIVPLILKPGKVAYEFVSGKRKVYVNPFRTYLTISLIFFLFFNLINTIYQYNGGENKSSLLNFNFGNNNKEQLTKAQTDSIINIALSDTKRKLSNLDSIKKSDTIKNNTSDSIKNNSNSFNGRMQTFWVFYRDHKDLSVVEALDSLGYENTFWNRFYYDKAKDSQDMIDDGGEGLSSKIFSGLSLAIFLFLPVFALFLKLIYIRRKYTYMEHMVFVFYTQSVFFLLMLLFIGISYFTSGSSDTTIQIFMLLFSVYLILAMKNFYKQGWFKTIFKFLLANFSFIIMASIGFSVLSVVAFIFY